MRTHPRLVDGGLSLTLLVAAVVALYVDIRISRLSDPSYQPPGLLWLVLTTTGLTVPLAWRRRFPLTVLAVVMGSFVTARLVGNPDVDVALFAIPIAVYSAGTYGGKRLRGLVFTAAATAAMAELTRELVQQIPEYKGFLVAQAFDFVLNLAMLLVAWALGVTTRSRHEQQAQLASHAAALEQQREDNARAAVFAERVRIARELHDVVAHHVSLMGVQAGAARRVMDRQPAKAVSALESIESTSRQAVVEMQRMLGFLRQEDEVDELLPQPGLGQLDGLVSQLASAKLEVDVVVEGQQRPLPRSVELSAYRIVQEALTNTLKHADADRVAVTVRYAASQLEVEVVDDGRAAAQSGTDSNGHGLIGMRERALLHGGELVTGRRPEGGFAVHAIFPLNGAT